MRKPFILTLGLISISAVISLHLLTEPASARNLTIGNGAASTGAASLNKSSSGMTSRNNDHDGMNEPAKKRDGKDRDGDEHAKKNEKDKYAKLRRKCEKMNMSSPKCDIFK